MIIPSGPRTIPRALALTALALGIVAAFHYATLDLTLSHYDARGHLVVARRIFDNLTPGWRQIGAIWLPLPHLLNAVPVQFDPFYRTGVSAVTMSIVSFAAATAAVGWIVGAVTASRAAAVGAALVFALNPNVLYLQATPMTEPLLLGLMLPALAMLMAWCRDGRPSPMAIGSVFALACLTRYEAWPMTAAAIAMTVWVKWRMGAPRTGTLTDAVRLAAMPTAAIVLFSAFSKVVVGAWFVSSGFFVPDNPVRDRPLAVAESILRGTDDVTGHGLLMAAGIGLIAVFALVLRGRLRPFCVLPWTLLAPAALPFAAFLSGHPYRVRYMVPLVAAVSVGAGIAAGLPARGRSRMAGLALLLAVAALELRPFSPSAPMVQEAQWDRPYARERATVTTCLREQYDGRLILASMSSLGHYMQELSRADIRVRDFVHEGTGEAWRQGLTEPGPDVGWILLSENPDGRDALARPVRENPAILRRFSRVCEGGQVALYRRDDEPPPDSRSAR